MGCSQGEIIAPRMFAYDLAHSHQVWMAPFANCCFQEVQRNTAQLLEIDASFDDRPYHSEDEDRTYPTMSRFDSMVVLTRSLIVVLSEDVVQNSAEFSYDRCLQDCRQAEVDFCWDRSLVRLEGLSVAT